MTMRAKMMVMNVSANVTTDAGGNSVTNSEQLRFAAVGPNTAYNPDGTGDEDNTFSRWTPCASLDITIQNPALFGQFNVGDKYYVDFTPAGVAVVPTIATDADVGEAAEERAAEDRDNGDAARATEG
ncbi:conserved hypothetical protein [Paraburkholderia piptadeniae]|uniref:Uncharacterized protein n=1 Tax=Paraburkholderia piptadeniae TaxID=1701573 RepID=A0A1N7S8N8_9BURK|nr:hypothetical protein [Paraburkholderia piptadeniae]SIT43702.1 conserved hypothetical protein [Paraburkholderia piptadeniae]